MLHSLISYIISKMTSVRLLIFSKQVLKTTQVMNTYSSSNQSLKRDINELESHINELESYIIRMMGPDKLLNFYNQVYKITQSIDTHSSSYQSLKRAINELENMISTNTDFDDIKNLKELLIRLFAIGIDNIIIEQLRLDLNDYIVPALLVTYAEQKLDKARSANRGDTDIKPLEDAYEYAKKAVDMDRKIGTIVDLGAEEFTDVKKMTEDYKSYIAQATNLLYKFEDSIPLSSVAAKLSKRRIRKNIRNTKRIRKYKRKKTRRSTH